jgi:hypothetical protein
MGIIQNKTMLHTIVKHYHTLYNFICKYFMMHSAISTTNFHLFYSHIPNDNTQL